MTTKVAFSGVVKMAKGNMTEAMAFFCRLKTL
jgi:hypothetical protein